jgi:hypothetical protein
MNQSYNILNDFNPEQYNLLVPVQSIQEINPIYRLVINQVRISTELPDKDIYREKSAGDGMYALTHKALMKLFTAANGQIVASERVRSKICDKCIEIVKATKTAPQCGSCPANANVCCRIIVKFPELSGGWRLVQATREIDFSNMPAGATDGQIRQTKAFAFEHAESKALSRCIRKGLSIKSAYSMDELAKPFIVIYPVLDSKDADVKKALIAGAIASSNLLYGSGLMLGAGQQAALPEGRSDVDKETGEIIDQNDYEAEPPEEQKPWDVQPEEKYFCSNPDCKLEVSKVIADKSKAEFGFIACTKCQQLARKAKKEGGK